MAGNTAMQQPNLGPPPAILPARQPIQVEPEPFPVPAPTRNEGGGAVSSLAAESSLRNQLDGDRGLVDTKMAQALARARALIAQEEQSAARPIQAPAVAPLAGTSLPAPAANNPAPAPADEVLPTVNELTASGRSFPTMRLDIHSFADNPAERFVFVNMRRYNEGQTLQEGPSIERITVEGVVLNQQGLRFVLPRP
jgi:general secretion pathway protein B